MKLCESGYFSRTHGTKGQLVFKAHVNFDPEALKVLFLDVSGSKAPYFVQAYKSAGAELVVCLEGIDSPEKAKALLNKTVFIDEVLLQLEEESGYEGFKVIEVSKGLLGEVDFVSENGAQQLLHIQFNGKEIILPLVEEFIEELDTNKKLIKYRAPEGLIEVYLEGE